MIKGNSDVIWGFFDDIWHWHHQKISPNDPAAIAARSASLEKPRKI